MKSSAGVGLALLIGLCLVACGMGKQSAVEGKLLDSDGKPLAGVKITASQVQPIKGYEQAETVTGADGAFRLSGLFPSSQYVLKPWIQDWSAAPLMGVKFQQDVAWALFSNTGWFSSNKIAIQAGPEGETSILKPLLLEPMASQLEGKVVDTRGQPLEGVKIVASQVQPIKGYEQAETVTGADGAFRLRGLFPSSQYVLKPWVQDWSVAPLMGVKFPEDAAWALFSNTGWFSSNKTGIQTGPEGETLILKPLLLEPMASQLEGKVVDCKGQPLEGVRIIAAQREPVKGYERFEVVTKSDGTFTLRGLFPNSDYVLSVASNVASGAVRKSASAGEAARLAEHIILRFQRSEEGVITDSQTGLEWVVGPERDTSYAQAEQWVAACNVAGGGWRMPTLEELSGLCHTGVGEQNRDPSFKSKAQYVWAEPRDSSAWDLNFGNCWAFETNPDISSNLGVFGVRSKNTARTKAPKPDKKTGDKVASRPSPKAAREASPGSKAGDRNGNDAYMNENAPMKAGISLPGGTPTVLDAWAGLVQMKVNKNWQIPSDLQLGGTRNEAIVSFWVDKNGNLIGKPEIMKESTDPEFAQSGMQAILLSVPLPPLPQDFPALQQQVIYVFSLAK